MGKRRWILSSIKGIGGTECLDGGEPLKRKIVYAQRVRLNDRWCRRWTAANGDPRPVTAETARIFVITYLV